MKMDFPLRWPAGWPRTKRPQRAAFTTTFSRSRTGLTHELRRLGARDVVLSSDIPIRQDGEPYQIKGADRPEDAGVAVYFTFNNEQRVIPCDKWNHVKDNVRAIEKTVEALRGIERWGASEMMHAAFQGFAALPTGATGAGWWDVLEVARDAPHEAVRRAYLAKVKSHHPDAGGSPGAFSVVQEAWSNYEREMLVRR